MEVDATEWDAICRICLQEGQLHSLFDFDDENAEINIAEKIMQCSTIEITTDDNLPEQICTDCLIDLDVAYRFRKNCERSDAILQSFVDSTVETIIDDYPEQNYVMADEPENTIDDSSVLVNSDSGLYEYRPPIGLNVKRVKTERLTAPTKSTLNNKVVESPLQRKKQSTQLQPQKRTMAPQYSGEQQMIYLKSEPLEEEILEEERIDETLYDTDIQFDDSVLESEKQMYGAVKKTPAKVLSEGSSEKQLQSDDQDQSEIKIMQIKAVKTNKIRLGHSSANDTKAAKAAATNSSFGAAKKANQSTSKENVSNARLPKGKSAKGEPKQPKTCQICGNSYMYQHALESHMRRHRNEKPFVCSVCGKGFVINFELSRHMRTHTGQKPYACKYCDRRFSDFGSRVKHERIHTGERPYACDICGKTFAYSHVLSSHNLIHTGEKKYHCEVCGKRFAKSHHLKSHMNTHNKNNSIKIQSVQSQQQQQQQQQQEEPQLHQEYSLQVIDEQSELGTDPNELTEYISLSQADIVTKVDDDDDDDQLNDGTSDNEGQLLLYSDVDVDVLDAIKVQNAVLKRKYVDNQSATQLVEDENGIQHEITIADHQDPIELLTFEEDELE